ncbi:MAG: IS6 family transposase [Acidobacteriaceae bacterium]|nr:IS6 family transposase [Acidobacteriaceae bacterium]
MAQNRRKARNPLFAKRWFADDVIILCVRWYLHFQLSYRDVAEIAWELGVVVSPSTILRWVVRYAAEFEQRWQKFERPVGRSWRADETYIKVRGQWMYLYRAVDERGRTVESYLSRTRDISAAKAFFRKALKHHGEPRTITLDGFEPSHAALRRMGMNNEFNFRWKNPVKIRSCQYLNNIVEQDHRRIKFRVQSMLGFKSFYNARRVLLGIELVKKIVKGQYQVPARFGCSLQSIWNHVLAS